MPAEPQRHRGLHASFVSLDPREPLADDVLAAVVFGADTPCPQDPRALRIDLEPLAGDAHCEVWRGSGKVRLGTAGPIRHAEDGNCFAGWLSIDEGRVGGILQATEDAYMGLLRLQADSPYRHVWRVWNFITDINEGRGDEERYRQFCLGRARAFAAIGGTASVIGYPAATAVGRQGGPRSLQVCWFAGREPGTTIENPRQVSAYHYPRSYGPAAPSFSRAMVVPGPLYLVSGTSSIVGHASMHDGDLESQLRETLVNIDTLLHRARASGNLASAALDADSLVKAYVRRRSDAGQVAAGLRDHFGPDVPTLIVAADICRSELLLEIEVLHRG
jgi:chorismate lyase / 3-hydroxybenzoate synthase